MCERYNLLKPVASLEGIITSMNLYEKIAQEVGQWRSHGYPCEDYSSISEILQWASDPDGEGFRLRIAQLRALETYWYIRLCEGTPHTFELYRALFNLF